ncbi:helix-turn-helix domain-containing protein [Pseudoalteromonas luteoviolacea]|uniref:helix-turn-helix domain-containing protein n=1 Tax=Pseudoalteromonas luteoviolacea TaxID=43657 RepID=UPI001B363C9C|nr:helix-turn-helix transcriptional regulator [Pseudoalteromonas luteoviolacea]MBQ4835441.1 helix-turn-helix transcriptional regulator [Pseudoalteromonas luteoviolacea]
MKIGLKDFGYLCRHLRVKDRITQEALALEIGVAVSTIERIENGKVIPRIDSMFRILDHLNYELHLVGKIK